MLKHIQVTFTPAEFAVLPAQNLEDSVCVVFDILRATSTIATALWQGATAVIPAQTIEEALALRRGHPDALLAGERQGRRITGADSGGVEFELGNSPREFTTERVSGRVIITTTTNGTRALRACAHAGCVLAGSFLNLRATAEAVLRSQRAKLLIVCAGTHEDASYEDTLAAGALVDLLLSRRPVVDPPDSAQMARLLFLQTRANLPQALASSQNGRRLAEIPELKDDLTFCAALDRFGLVAAMDAGGALTGST